MARDQTDSTTRLIGAERGCAKSRSHARRFGVCTGLARPALLVGVVVTVVMGQCPGFMTEESGAAPLTPEDGSSVTAGIPAGGPSWTSSDNGLVPAVPPSAGPDRFLDDIVANQLGPGWVAGDGCYSTALPGGREAFVFSDTLIGKARHDGAASVTGVTHSSELVGRLPHLLSDFAGTFRSPAATMIPDSLTKSDSWQLGATYASGGHQLIFVNEFDVPAGGQFGTFAGHSGIAVMRTPASGRPTLKSIVTLPTDSDTQWGNALLRSGGFLYVYGSDIDPTTHTIVGMKVARVASATSLQASRWTYWDGAGWVPSESSAAAVPTLNQLTGVTPNPSGRGFVAVSVPGTIETDDAIDLSYAIAPQGPWSAPAPVYRIPQIRQYRGEFAYMATFHPELSSHSVLVVSYSTNSTRGLVAVGRNVHTYQPHFVLLRG